MRISDRSSDVCSSDLRVVKGVNNGPSPEWLAKRLAAIGQRPISALVDITNYVMIGWGRPLHVYDLAKLNGALVARKARAGETVEALNGKTYALDDTMTVIADDAAVHDVGRSEEHTSALQSLMRISYAVFCLQKKKRQNTRHT